MHASTTADGCAERVVAATMLADVCRPDSRVTVGADKNFDTRGFVSACRKMKIPRMLHKIPDVLAVVSSTAASLHTTRHPASTGGNA